MRAKNALAGSIGEERDDGGRGQVAPRVGCSDPDLSAHGDGRHSGTRVLPMAVEREAENDAQRQTSPFEPEVINLVVRLEFPPIKHPFSASASPHTL